MLITGSAAGILPATTIREQDAPTKVSDAAEILIDATKAFKSQGNQQGACLYPVRDQNSGKSYQAVFVKDRNAIVTFYPDATPQGKVCAVK